MGWEVQIRELAMVKLRRLVIDARSLFSGIKSPEKPLSSVGLEARQPLPPGFIPADALKSGSVRSMWPRIVIVFNTATWTQVLFSIIERVSAGMVNHSIYLKNCVGHLNPFPFRGRKTDRVNAATWRFVRGPIPLIDPVEVLGVNHGGISPGKRDVAEPGVDRLFHGMSLYIRFLGIISHIQEFSTGGGASCRG